VSSSKEGRDRRSSPVRSFDPDTYFPGKTELTTYRATGGRGGGSKRRRKVKKEEGVRKTITGVIPDRAHWDDSVPTVGHVGEFCEARGARKIWDYRGKLRKIDEKKPKEREEGLSRNNRGHQTALLIIRGTFLHDFKDRARVYVHSIQRGRSRRAKIESS